MSEERHYQSRETNQPELYSITINNNSGIYQKYEQNEGPSVAYAWDKMRDFWSGLVEEVEQEKKSIESVL